MKRIIPETARLQLREMEPSDIESLSSILQDSNTMYAYNGAFNGEETMIWIQKQLQRYKDFGFGSWGVRIRDRMIDQCGITMQEYKGMEVPEISYLLAHEYWHKGYAVETATVCREYGFNTLKFDELYSIVRDTNVASQKSGDSQWYEFRLFLLLNIIVELICPIVYSVKRLMFF